MYDLCSNDELNCYISFEWKASFQVSLQQTNESIHLTVADDDWIWNGEKTEINEVY